MKENNKKNMTIQNKKEQSMKSLYMKTQKESIVHTIIEKAKQKITLIVTNIREV